MSERRLGMAELDKCAISHRQGVFFRDSRRVLYPCDIRSMANFDMGRFRAQLEALMEQRGIKRKPLAQQAGLGETSIRDIFDVKRNDARSTKRGLNKSVT
jgi:hypothetical protein